MHRIGVQFCFKHLGYEMYRESIIFMLRMYLKANGNMKPSNFDESKV